MHDNGLVCREGRYRYSSRMDYFTHSHGVLHDLLYDVFHVVLHAYSTVNDSVKEPVKENVNWGVTSRGPAKLPFDPPNVPFGESRVPPGNSSAEVPVTQCIP